MNIANRGMGLGAAAVACLAAMGAGVSAQEPATSPSDAGTPKAAALAVLNTLKTGDLTATLALFAAETDRQKLAAETMVLEVLPSAAIEHALQAKFGADAHVDNVDGDMFKKEFSRVEWGVAVIDGDKAKFYLGSDGKPPVGLTEKADIVFKKIEGGWKVDATAQFPSEKIKEPVNSRKRYELAKDIAADIKAGKFHTAEEALASMRERFKALDKEIEDAAAKEVK